MFNCELKFVVDICKIMVNEKFMRKNLTLDMRTKCQYKKKNPVDFSTTNCVICNFNLAFATSNGPFSQDMTYSDFVVHKEHNFLRNVLNPDDLKLCKNIENIKVYFTAFENFMKIVFLLANRYNADSDILPIEQDFFAEFFADSQIASFSELFFEILQADVKNFCTLKKSKGRTNKDDKFCI